MWHMCVSYISEKGLDILSKWDLFGNHKVEHLQFCEHYVDGKQHRTKIPKIIHKTKAMLDYVHSDY